MSVHATNSLKLIDLNLCGCDLLSARPREKLPTLVFIYGVGLGEVAIIHPKKETQACILKMDLEHRSTEG